MSTPAFKSNTPAAALPSPTLPALNAAHASAIAQLLTEYIAQQRAQLQATLAHRQALSTGDTAAIARCTGLQRQSAQALLDLDAKRAALIRTIVHGNIPLRAALAITDRAAPPITIRQLIARCPANTQTQLTTLATELRTLALESAREQSTLRAAAQSLVGHMHGLMERVGRALSHTGNYRRPGAANTAGAVVVSSVDVLS